MARMIIYKVVNNINNKIYIGKTTQSISIRKRHHEKPSNVTYFGRAIKKYGKSNFTWSVIDEANTEEDLNNKEIYYIKAFKSNDVEIGYNLTLGGEGASGYRYSSEMKAKMSERMLGSKNPMYGLFGTNNPCFGSRRTRDQKENMRCSEHRKKAISKAQKGRIKTSKELQKIKSASFKYMYIFDNHADRYQVLDIVEFCKNNGINYKVLRNSFSLSSGNLIKYKHWIISRDRLVGK